MALNTHSLDLEAGSSQYATADDSASLSITGNLTIEAWVKIENAPGSGAYYAIVNKYLSATGDQRSYSFYYFNNSGTFQLLAQINSDGTGSGGADGAVNVTLTPGTWFHVAMVYTAAAGTVEFFLDGVSQGTASSFPTSIYNSTSPCRIGADAEVTPGSFFDGLIDEVRIWATTKTAANLVAAKDNHLAGNEANLQAYWRLNNVYTDTTANGNTLTASGTPVFSTDVPFVGTLSGGSLFFSQL